MIPVSQEFKTAIKAKERQIKGYVELINNAKDVELTASTTYDETYTSVSNLVDGEPVKSTYGTLDNLPLDGTQLVMDNTPNEKSQFIISPTAGANKEITITLSRTEIDVITIIVGKIKLFYGESNYKLFTAIIKLYDGEDEVYDEHFNYTNDDINIKLDEPTYITKIEITLTPSYDAQLWNDTYMIKIDQIVLGDTKIIKDTDLVEFAIDEEVSKLVEEIPTNIASITIPRPTTESYLSNTFLSNMNEKTKIMPYSGVVTTNGPEYVKMGEFYFNDVKHNKDLTTTLYGNNIIEQLKNENMQDENETNILSPSSISSTDLESFMANYQYPFNVVDWKHNINTWAVYGKELIKFLSEIAFSQWDIFYANRNGELKMKSINYDIVGTITKSELLDDVIPIKLSKINTIELIRNYQSQEETGDSKEIYRGEFVLEKHYQYVLIESPTGNLINASFSIDGAGDITVLTKGYYLAFAIIDGTLGDTITIVGSSSKNTNQTKTPYIITNRGVNEKEVKLTFDSFTNQLPKYYMQNSPILNMTPSYEIELDYNGDPSYEAGDYVNVETEDGTIKPIFIEKHHFHFDGGCDGSIRGVE